MKIRLLAFGIAKDIFNQSELDFEISLGNSISHLKQKLIEQYPEFSKLQSLKFAINEDYQGDDYVIKQNDEVVIIPPVSGG